MADKIDPRKCSDLYRMLQEFVPHYTPEWAGSDEKDPGVALLKVFSHMTENVIHRLNEVPQKNFVAFLDMLGIKRLPPQPARAPVTFQIAKGIDREFLIPERTQVSADRTDEHDELPFETEKNLWATPSQLKSVVVFDPSKDAIYRPPPGFLDGKLPSQSQMAYKIMSSSFAGAKQFQLDHVTDLKEGDLLRIGGADNPEFTVISGISTTIVKVEDGLSIDRPVNTQVEKITKFNLFEGKNEQEHILYLGHKDLFNIKSAIQFSLNITHRPGTEEGVVPLELSWEYWGEVKGEEGEDWRKFNVIDDSTERLSKDGTIVLSKITEGEIKEIEINKVKSRWIRGVLKEPLVSGVPRKLPELDNITVAVREGEEVPILPDLAFNNDRQLDVNGPFNPFGKEPRLFDTFSVASKEVFSKKGGKIVLDFKVEQRGILGGTAAISYNGKIRVFAMGTYGKLFDIEAGGTSMDWKDRGSPPDAKIADGSTPSAVTYYSQYVSVFAKDENGHLVEGYYNGAQWQWLDHLNPKTGVSVQFNPSAIYKETGAYNIISVFVAGDDGHLHEFNRSRNGLVGNWKDHGKPDGIDVASSPYAAGYVTADKRVKVFVRGADGKLYELDCMAGSDSDDRWTNWESPGTAKVGSRPFAYVYEGESRQHRIITGYNGATRVATIDSNWTTVPDISSKYGIFVSVHKGTARGGGTSTITLASDASTTNDYYKDMEIEIIGGTGSTNPITTITNYDGSTRTATVSPAWGTTNVPDNTSFYRVMQSVHTGTAQAGTDSTIKLAIGASITDNAYKDMEIEIFSGTGSETVKGNYAKVFVKGDIGNLWWFDTSVIKRKWEDMGKPDSDSKLLIDSYPHGYIVFDPPSIEQKHIFVKGTDNYLWERTDSGWINHTAPARSLLKLSPFVLKENDSIHIFSASVLNSIIERVTDTTDFWNEYKDPNDIALTPTLSWEAWNKAGWVALNVIEDETSNLLRNGKITFMMPDYIEETEVAGQKNYWIRARIIGGDYGKETFEITVGKQLVSSKSNIRPPVVKTLTVGYSLEKSQLPQQSITYNNLEYLDQGESSKIRDKFFSPFIRLNEPYPSLYLGFEKYFKGGPVRIFFSAKELRFDEENKPKLKWTYSFENDWSELKGDLDYTEGMIKGDVLELNVSSDFSARTLFGDHRSWIKGSLVKGKYTEYPVLDGIYPNTTWALQAMTVKEEILGGSNGKPNQVFSFLRLPVLEGQRIMVREVLSEEEKQEIIDELGKDAIIEKKDEKGKVTETWVLWTEVPDFFDSDMKSRHYTLDRATGQVEFGDGINGMVPPVGNNNLSIVAYQTGGGAQGNVGAGEIKSLKSAVSGVDKVFNPVAADGGADAATIDQMLEIGPAMISHRNRAVTFEDFEWLAKKASRKVVKARCLQNTNKERKRENGWVTVIILPADKTPEPVPSLELKRNVRQYLEEHCATTLASVKHVNVDSPSYVEISVSADVFVESIDVASIVERDVRDKLDEFFHPLTGGPEGKGWDFGRDVPASDIYALLEDIDGVDHLENLKFSYNGSEGNEIVEMGQDFLVANGKHTINTLVKKEGGGYYESA